MTASPPGAARLPLPAVPSRTELRDHLIRSRIAGEVATSRENNLANFGRMSARDPLYLFGLDPVGSWSPAEVLELMAERVGVRPEPGYTSGIDTIDPDLTLDRLDAMAARLAAAGRRRERVIVATGHPGGVGAIHTETARALHDAGCTLLTPAEGAPLIDQGRPRHLRFVGSVAMASSGGGLAHTHSPVLMEAMLTQLRGAGEPPPDLVVADHGWAGAAGQAGIDAVGYADCNDPALFVGEAEGRVLVSVPLDDNVLPQLYRPLTAYLLRELRSQPSQ